VKKTLLGPVEYPILVRTPVRAMNAADEKEKGNTIPRAKWRDRMLMDIRKSSCVDRKENTSCASPDLLKSGAVREWEMTVVLSTFFAIAFRAGNERIASPIQLGVLTRTSVRYSSISFLSPGEIRRTHFCTFG